MLSSISLTLSSLGMYKTTIIYNKNMDINTAIKTAFELSSRDDIAEVATELHKVCHTVIQ